MVLQNQFGILANEYAKGRREYPQELFEYLKSLKLEMYTKVLDVGCGTGIATRQLKEYGFEVVGVDKDTQMIEKAKSKNDGITYFVAPADNLPFEDAQYDIITTFTSLHWFDDDQSMIELKRVLKESGLFFSALKWTEKDTTFYREFKSISEKYVGSRFDSSKNYKPKELLEKWHFKNIHERTFYQNEQYSVNEALTWVRSISFWNLVNDNERVNILSELEAFFLRYSNDGLVAISRVITTTAGLK
jgi:ubiquinone/menaquinone biosynthesis C-methylase UbiE